MSFENPTPLRVGQTGTLEGRRLRIAGRVVMGMEQDGETYYWNEFNLVDGFGRGATLVHEETEDGAEWKVFKLFEPLRPLSAGDAAQKRVGDTVELDGIRRRVSLVDQSRVHHIEGSAPEGVQEGDVANYFNVDTDRGLLVVSWTGDEVECYEGHRVDAATVAKAFGVTLDATGFKPQRSFTADGGLTGGFGEALKAIGVGSVLLVSFCTTIVNHGGCGGGRASLPDPVAKRAAPTLRLPRETEGRLGAQSFRIGGDALVEINRVGPRHDRREYQLLGDNGQGALLVQGLTGGAHEWHLLWPVAIPPPWSPLDAAARRSGASLEWPGTPMKITELFQAKRLTAEGRDTRAWPELQYGFLAQGRDEWLLARWNETRIDFYRGKSVPEGDVLSGFRAGVKK